MKHLKSAKVLSVFTLVVAVVSVVFAVLSLKRLQTQYSVMQFLPTHHPALAMDQSVRRRFHLQDHPLFIGLLALKPESQGTWLEPGRVHRLAALTVKLKSLSHVETAISVATVEGAAQIEGALSVGELVQLLPPQKWKDRILHDNLLTPTLISKDGRTALVYMELKNADAAGLVKSQARFKSLLSQSFPEVTSSVGGVPAVQTDLGLLLNKELINFLALTVLACTLTLLAIFQTWSTIWLPLILVAYCNLMVFAMMAWTGITFTVLSSTIPILVFITVMSLSVHSLLRVYEDGRHAPKGETKWQLILRANRAIWLPNLLGALTTCVGFLTLLTSDVPLIRTYGTAVGAAVMLSWALTTVGLIPLALLFPRPVPRAWVHEQARWALWVIVQRRAVVIGTLLACMTLMLVGRHLDWTGRLFDDLPKGQEARQSTEKIDSTMGGVVPLEIVIRTPKGSDWKDPQRIQRLDKLAEQLRQMHGVGTVQGLSDFMRASGLRGAHLPATRAAVAETYFLYAMAAVNPLTQFLTNDNRSARIELKIHDLPANEVENLLERLRHHIQSSFPDSQVQMGGMGATVHLIHYEISHDLIFGFWQAMLLIVILLAVIFRSLRWALVACIPNLVPPVFLLGYLALTHTPIKPGVAIIFSIALGLAFNNTVYVLNRLRQVSRRGGPLRVNQTFFLEGNPCLVSTLVVMMGFSVFLFSYFSLNRTFGACMLVSILAGILGDLVFLPALLKMAPWLIGSIPALPSEAAVRIVENEPALEPPRLAA